jgi:dinuclear metal center YbgI/SA1388 family protein
MVQLSTVIEHLHKWAPPSLAATWDNVGLQLGDPAAEIRSVLLSLDVDLAVLDHIQTQDIDLVITHHPIFFKPISSINYTDDMGQIISTFISTTTHLFSMHTNLDAAVGGVNDALLSLFGFSREEGAPIEGEYGRYFELSSPKPLTELNKVMPSRIVGATQETVSKVGFLAGSGHGILKQVKELGLDCLITGELTYHDEVYCELNGITALLLGHKESEVPILPYIKTSLMTVDSTLEILLSPP